MTTGAARRVRVGTVNLTLEKLLDILHVLTGCERLTTVVNSWQIVVNWFILLVVNGCERFKREMKKMTKIRDLAAELGCTPENIYKQIRKYKDGELKGHIQKQYGASWLDDEGVRIIKDRMIRPAVVVSDGAFTAKIEALQDENKALLLQLNATQNALTEAQKGIIELKDTNTQLMLENQEIKLLSAQKKGLLQRLFGK